MTKIQSEIETAFISLISACKNLVIPLLNEFFGTKFIGDENVRVLGNQIHVSSKKESHTYLFCVEQGPDDALVVLPCELLPEIKTEVSAKPLLTGTTISVASEGILYLRGYVPDKHKLDLSFKLCSTGSMMNLLPIKSLYDYGEDMLFDKGFYILLPFWLTSDPAKTLFGNRVQAGYTMEYVGKIHERLRAEVVTNRLSQENAEAIIATSNRLLRILWMDYVYPEKSDEQ